MEGFLVIPFAGLPGEDIEDTISSVEVAYAARGLDVTLDDHLRLKAMALILRNAIQDPDDNEHGPKSFLAELDKTILNDFGLLSEKLKGRFPVVKRERRKSRLQFFEDVASLQQQPKETIQDYVKRARNLAAGIEIYDREALNNKFIQGIRNSEIRISVRALVAMKGEVNNVQFETVADTVLELADEVRPAMRKNPAPRRADRLPSSRTKTAAGAFSEGLENKQLEHTRGPVTSRSDASISSTSRSIASRSIASVTAVGEKLRGLRGHNLSLAQLILIVAPSFILFGYNQAGVGGLLSVLSPTSAPLCY